MSHLISIRLPKELCEALEKVSAKTDRSKSYLIRKAVEEFLKDADARLARDKVREERNYEKLVKDLKKILGRRM